MERYPPSARRVWLGALSEEEKVARHGRRRCASARPRRAASPSGWCCSRRWRRGARWSRSDIDGYRQAAGGHARLVPPENPDVLASALAEALSDAEVGIGVSAPKALASARRHLERWSMAELARRYEEIYRRVLGGAEAPVH